MLTMAGAFDIQVSYIQTCKQESPQIGGIGVHLHRTRLLRNLVPLWSRFLGIAFAMGCVVLFAVRNGCLIGLGLGAL